jgi:glycosyltransferase involved in cell wall biosynthesis
MKEITIFANNDINNINTWSGVPYFFSKALKSRGIKINYVSINVEKLIEWIYNKITGTVIIKILHNQRADYSTSLLRYLIVRHRIRRGIYKYPNSDCLIFFTFCYSAAGITKIPSIMISDWTLDYYMKFILQRNPGFFERRVLKRDDRQIEATKIIFSLFPEITEYMKSKYNNANIYFLGNAVNSEHEPPDDPQNMIQTKYTMRNLLFIGGKKYLPGLDILIKTFQILRGEFPDIRIHIIGLSAEDVSPQYRIDGVSFYGYLDKNDTNDSNTYYKLLSESTIYINTTPAWPSFQAPVEAMFFYSPIIISFNIEFIKIFGKEIENCCFFCKENTQNILADHIRYILNNKNYDYLCKSAHNCVKDFTWDAVVDNFLKITSKCFYTE